MHRQMDRSGEVLALQVGPLANTLGVQLWNKLLLSSSSAAGLGSVLRCDSDGKLHPNALCVDAKGGFGRLALDADAVDLSEDALPWAGPTMRVDRRAESSVGTAALLWSDTMTHAYYTERALHCLECVRVGVSTPFTSYAEGLDAMASADEVDRLHNALRWWAESTESSLGAVRLLFDSDSGFAGVSEVALLYLSEEHSKVDVMAVGLEPAQLQSPPASQSLRNAASCAARLYPYAALALPLCDARPNASLRVVDTLGHFSSRALALSQLCNSVTRAKANLAWTRVTADARAVADCTRALSLLRLTECASPIATPLAMPAWRECRFARHVVALVHPAADALGAELAAPTGRHDLCVSTALHATGARDVACVVQLGQTAHVSQWLRALAGTAGVDEETRNSLSLQAEDYVDQ